MFNDEMMKFLMEMEKEHGLTHEQSVSFYKQYKKDIKEENMSFFDAIFKLKHNVYKLVLPNLQDHDMVCDCCKTIIIDGMVRNDNNLIMGDGSVWCIACAKQKMDKIAEERAQQAEEVRKNVEATLKACYPMTWKEEMKKRGYVGYV